MKKSLRVTIYSLIYTEVLSRRQRGRARKQDRGLGLNRQVNDIMGRGEPNRTGWGRGGHSDLVKAPMQIAVDATQVAREVASVKNALAHEARGVDEQGDHVVHGRDMQARQRCKADAQVSTGRRRLNVEQQVRVDVRHLVGAPCMDEH